MILYTSVKQSVHRALLGQNGFFRVFEGSFLEVPRVVQFHATVIHCYHGMDADDTSIFVLGSESVSYTHLTLPTIYSV